MTAATSPPPEPFPDLLLFDDLPKDEIDAESDPCRLHQTATVLESLLRKALKQGDNRCVGLFGGLGQGKSTVLKTVARRIGEMNAPKGFSWHLFNTADHKPETLEFEFDRLVAHWQYRRIVFWTALIFGVITLAGMAPLALMSWIVHLIFPSQGFFSLFGKFLAWATLGIVAPAIAAGTVVIGFLGKVPYVSHWLRDIELQKNFNEPIWRGIFPRRPSLLFIDNLDRASIAQQRAILRAIHKHRDKLNLPIVVAMDVEGLFVAKPDPECADELLRKVLDVVVHLPLRIADDVPEIVTALASDAANNNENNPFGKLLKDPQIIGDLARAFSLLPGFGPRRVKRFFNDLMVACCGLSATHRDDVAATIRFIGLLSVAPPLQRHGDALLSILAANDHDALGTLIDTHCPDVDKAVLIAFFRATRHMQPIDRHWRRVVATMPSETRDDAGVGATTLTGRVSEWATAVAAGRHGIHWPSPGKAMDVSLPSALAEPPSFLAPFPSAWAAFDAACCRQGEAKSRLRLYQEFKAAPDTFTTPEMKTEHIDLIPLNRAALAMLHRLWTADWDVLEVMRPADRQALINELWAPEAPETLRLLFSVPGQYLQAIDRLSLLADRSVIGGTDTHSAATWLQAAVISDCPPAHSQTLPLQSTAKSRLAFVWPGFDHEYGDITDADCLEELLGHLSLIKKATGGNLAPEAHGFQDALFKRGWLARNRSEPKLIAKAICHLFTIPSEGEQSPDSWTDTVFKALFSTYSDERRKIILSLALHITLEEDAKCWWITLLLACQNDDAGADIVASLMSSMPMSGKTPRCDAILLDYLLRSDLLWKIETTTSENLLHLFRGVIAEGAGDLIGLHDRLRQRTDYGHILRSTSALPPLPSGAISDDGIPSESYFNHLAAVTAAGLDTVRHTAHLLMLLKCPTIAVESRCLFDVAGLLGGNWRRDDKWTLGWPLAADWAKVADINSFTHGRIPKLIADLEMEWIRLPDILKNAGASEGEIVDKFNYLLPHLRENQSYTAIRSSIISAIHDDDVKYRIST